MSKTVSEKWKEHFASMEKVKTKSKTEKVQRAFPSVKRQDMKILLYVRELLRRQKENAEARRRAHEITQVNKTEYALQPGSIEHYLFQVLSVTDDEVHVKWIIPHMEALGWHSTSEYHKYALVHKALARNEYMFLRVGPGLFKLREGFRNRKPEKPEVTPPVEEGERSHVIPTIRDIVKDITQRYSVEQGIYPARVHYIMRCMGYKCAYSTVYRSMQCDDFTREGNWYKLNDTCINPKKTEG